MATTSIWSVKGWLGKLVIYVENPEKTQNPKTAEGGELPERERSGQDVQSLSDVIAYAIREEKTGQAEGGELLQQYVSGVNCSPVTARMEMMAVKKRFGKDEGIMAYHGYQSFAPGECTPPMAHEIGVKMAEELWGGDFQVLVATHLDKAHHLHNHFVVNSVSFLDGRRYHRTKQDYRDMRAVSDRLCLEYGLSVIKEPQDKAKHYGEWRAEKEGRPTYRGLMKEDVDEAVRRARTEKQFFQFLKEKGYEIKIGKDITLRAEGRERGLKLARNLGEDYTMESLRRRILEETEKETESCSRPKKRKNYPSRYPVRGSLKKAKRVGGLRGLYFHYCFLLGILPKNRPPMSHRQVSHLFREDLIKMNTIVKETGLLCRYRIDTAEQLFLRRETAERQIDRLAEKREQARNRLRRTKEEAGKERIRTEIAELTGQMRELRKEVVLCDGIAARSGVIKEKIGSVRREKKEKEGKNHEHIRRGR